MKELEFPQVMFCPKSALKSEELVAMGRAAGVNFTEDFLKPQMLPYNSNFNLTDIDEIWKNGTYQKSDFGLVWMVEDGKLRLDAKFYSVLNGHFQNLEWLMKNTLIQPENSLS